MGARLPELAQQAFCLEKFFARAWSPAPPPLSEPRRRHETCYARLRRRHAALQCATDALNALALASPATISTLGGVIRATDMSMRRCIVSWKHSDATRSVTTQTLRHVFRHRNILGLYLLFSTHWDPSACLKRSCSSIPRLRRSSLGRPTYKLSQSMSGAACPV